MQWDYVADRRGLVGVGIKYYTTGYDGTTVSYCQTVAQRIVVTSQQAASLKLLVWPTSTRQTHLARARVRMR